MLHCNNIVNIGATTEYVNHYVAMQQNSWFRAYDGGYVYGCNPPITDLQVLKR